MEPKTTVPSWLKTLLSLTTFFNDCEDHNEELKRECSIFCIDCCDKACIHCIQSSHQDHEFIQIRRSSNHNVVKVLDIENDFDISEIQTYVIDRFNVVYLNMWDWEEPKNCKYNSHCQTCTRKISDSNRFCSLWCKYAWIQESESESESDNMSGCGSESSVTSAYNAEGIREIMEEEEIAETLIPPQEEKYFSEQISKKRRISTSVQLKPIDEDEAHSSTNVQLKPIDDDEAHSSTSRKNKATYIYSKKRKRVPLIRAPIFRVPN